VRKPLADLARDLGCTAEDAAEGVIEVADAAMEGALRVISVERGFDPADFALVAFGGAGGLHAAELAGRLGAARALVPPDPGLLSAYGILAAPLTREASRTVLADTEREGTESLVSEELSRLADWARASLLEEGAEPSQVTVERWVDARYRGQSFELRVPADGWEDAFHADHEVRYGYARRGAPLVAVTVRAVASAPGPTLEAVPLDSATAPPPLETGRVRYRGREYEAGRVWRRDLRAGHRLDGPIIVMEYSGTTWVPPDWRVEVDAWGTLHLIPGGAMFVAPVGESARPQDG
jgi:N-methylhydantoinase A